MKETMHRLPHQQAELDYLELGPRIATWANFGFHWGVSKDKPWHVEFGGVHVPLPGFPVPVRGVA